MDGYDEIVIKIEVEIDQKRLNCNLLEPFKTLLNCANSQKWLPRSDSN